MQQIGSGAPSRNLNNAIISSICVPLSRRYEFSVLANVLFMLTWRIAVGCNFGVCPHILRDDGRNRSRSVCYAKSFESIDANFHGYATSLIIFDRTLRGYGDATQ